MATADIRLTYTVTIRGPYVPTLIDDGTLDTVIQVKGPNLTREYRFTYDPQPDENETYEEFVEWAKRDALNEHMDFEFHYVERKMEIEEGFYDEDDIFNADLEQLYWPFRNP
jgi:hypothetical protein